MAVTFKKTPRATGLARVTEMKSFTEIRINGKRVGLIVIPLGFKDNVRIRLMIKCEEHPGWKWATLKAGFEDEGAARATLKAKEKYIVDKLDLHYQEI